MIISPTNPRLKLVKRLQARRQREKLGLFACEGEDLVAAALAAGITPVEALVDAQRPPRLDGLEGAESVVPRLLAEASTLGHPPRVIAVFRRDDLPRLEPGVAPAVGLALWRIGDPGNLGTLLRTADALGPCSVALSDGCADPTSPKALRAAMGAIFRVPLGSFDEARKPLFALVPHGGEPIEALGTGPATFVLGAEREGLPDELLAGCERRFSVPQTEQADSLNVAASGAIALYEWRRQNPEP